MTHHMGNLKGEGFMNNEMIFKHLQEEIFFEDDSICIKWNTPFKQLKKLGQPQIQEKSERATLSKALPVIELLSRCVRV